MQTALAEDQYDGLQWQHTQKQQNYEYFVLLPGHPGKVGNLNKMSSAILMAFSTSCIIST